MRMEDSKSGGASEGCSVYWGAPSKGRSVLQVGCACSQGRTGQDADTVVHPRRPAEVSWQMAEDRPPGKSVNGVSTVLKCRRLVGVYLQKVALCWHNMATRVGLGVLLKHLTHMVILGGLVWWCRRPNTWTISGCSVLHKELVCLLTLLASCQFHHA